MDIPWRSEPSNKFVNNVGLITSYGKKGDNIMSAEWTHHVSHEPGIIAVCIDREDTTYANIIGTKEFGVNLCAEDQSVISSISGNNSGNETDKIGALKELGYKFFKGKKTKLLMVEGAALQVECKLVKSIELGDRTMFVGEAVYVHPVSGKQPLIYHSGKYWKFGEQIHKPKENELKKIKEIVERNKIN